MTEEERTVASAKARSLLAAQPLWQKAQSVLLFAPLPEELDIWPLLLDALRAGKQVALPRFNRQTKSYAAFQIQDPDADVETGHFGIREPNAQCPALASGPLDLILVPGVAFDRQGHRLGRGKGYYDKLLTVLRGRRCGVAFDQQVVEEIPVEGHDARMDCVLTPTLWMRLHA